MEIGGTVWLDGGCTGVDTAMLIDALSGTVPRREAAELVERRVDEDGGLDAEAGR
jgi:hypothetical protein